MAKSLILLDEEALWFRLETELAYRRVTWWRGGWAVRLLRGWRSSEQMPSD